MALYLCLNEDGTGIVSNDNPIQTKHTSNGEPVTIALYIVNDGKRTGVVNDTNPPALMYTNIQIRIEGVSYTLETALTPSMSDVTLLLDSCNGWNIGTIIKSGTERMRVEEILTDKSVRVQRNYTADGKASTIQSHNIGAMMVPETTDLSLALPTINDFNTAGTFGAGGASLTVGLDPSNLTQALDANDSSNIVRSSRGALYEVGSVIKIDGEEMKILSKVGNELTVLRGYNQTRRTSHTVNAVIYCVGIVDIGTTHKFFLKNDPPSGLPTQKKQDVKITIISNEEPI